MELTVYDEYKDGRNTRDLICKQWPVWAGTTTIALSSAGQALPQATINVASTKGFNPGTFGDPSATPPRIAVQVGTSAYITVTYTGTTSTSFTGCSGGTGTLQTNGFVYSPCVWSDPQGYSGQSPSAFAESSTGPSTLLIMGTQYMVNVDGGGGGSGSAATGRKSARGTIRRIAGGQDMWPGYFGGNMMYGGKLAAYRKAVWPPGDGNIKVSYSAGYTQQEMPLGIVNATKQLVAWMVRNNPGGSPLSSESLGGYSYSVLSGSADDAEIGSIRRLLARHREGSA